MSNGMINRENYEAFFLDYVEGNLTKEEREKLFLFLKGHPGLMEELGQYEEFTLSPEEMSFREKEQLKKADLSFKRIDDFNAEEAMIAFWEGVLTVEQRNRLEEYIYQNSGRQKDFELYGKLFLKPVNISFEGKKSLIRKNTRGFFRLYRVGVAAAVLALMALLFWQTMFRDRPVVDPMIAEVNNTLPVTEEIREPVSASRPVQSLVVSAENISPSGPSGEHGQIRKYPRQPESRMSVKSSRVKNSGAEKIAYCPVIREFSVPVREPVHNIVLENRYLQENNPENVLTLGEYVVLKIKRRVLDEDTARTPRLNARDIMMLGFKGFNKLTGMNLQVQKEENPVEKKEYFAFTSRVFSYTRVRPFEKGEK